MKKKREREREKVPMNNIKMKLKKFQSNRVLLPSWKAFKML